ncbi:MAG TPA: PaaI family thioesterase [Candidatus Angelobacter sp.]
MAKPKAAPGHAAPAKLKGPQNHCFACGKDNPHGMRLKFFIDEEARHAICNFKLARRYTGPPGHAHGGIIATVLDEAMGKINKLGRVVALTRAMNVEYLKPVPLGKPLTVIGRAQQVEGREHTNVAEITDAEGRVLARSTGKFIAVDVGMFAKFVTPSKSTQAQ